MVDGDVGYVVHAGVQPPPEAAGVALCGRHRDALPVRGLHDGRSLF